MKYLVSSLGACLVVLLVVMMGRFTYADAINATDFVTTWKTDNVGTSNSTSITIPTTGAGYNYSVDWNNDGIIDQTGITGSVTHDFGSAGTKTIRISGSFPRIYFNNGGDKSKLLQINQWGNIAWTSMANAFYGCNNLTISATDAPNLSAVTDMSYMFRSATSLTTNAAMNTWNTSNIVNMAGVFLSASSFNQNISNWNTRNVTNMVSMFESATVFNQPLTFNDNGTPGDTTDDKWNTGKVTSMNTMFQLASAFNQDIGSWDTSKVTSMVSMFNAASAFNNGGSPSINNWNTANVTSMFWLFRASSFNQPVGNWNTSKVTNMAGAFMTNNFNQSLAFNDNGTPGDTTDDKWNTANVTDMNYMFYGARYFNQDISGWNTGKVTNMNYMFQGALAFNQNIGGWNTGLVTNMAQMFQSASAFNQNIGSWDVSRVTNMSYMFNGASAFNNGGSPSINNWNTSLVTNMAGMFLNDYAFNQNINNWNTSNVNNMAVMFQSASSFNQSLIFDNHGTPADITDDKWNTSNVTNMSGMFQSATAFNGNIGSWDTSKVTNMSNMFKSAPAFNQNIGGWNTGLVTNMSWMFDGATNFNNGGSSGINNWNVSNVTLMYAMFRASKFNQNIGSWDTSKVTDMGQMFFGTTLFNQNIESWNTANVTTMQGMFSNNNVFNQPIGNWNTAKVTNMANMFHVSNFNQPIGNWNTGAVTNMQEMFRYANIFNQDISSWNTAAVTNMLNMFSYTGAFNQPIGNWNTAAVTTMGGMFQNATAFNQNVGNWNVGNVTTMANMFSGATLSINNYDALLVGWVSGGKTVRPSLSFHGGSSKYCNAAARTTLTSAPNSWTITDAGQDCTTISVTATTPYNIGMSQGISFTYTPTTSTGTTQCRLLDYNQAPLTAYQASSPISYTSPSAAGVYSYYVQCRNTTHPTANTISNTITVNVFSCSAVTDVPVAECNTLMNIYNNTGGANWTNKTGWGTSLNVCSWYGITCSGGHVISMALDANNLVGNSFITAGSLPSLTTLYLRTNQLTSFSGTGLPILQRLILNENQLTTFDGTGLTNLQQLELNSNQFSSFDGTGLTNLTELFLGWNQLTSFNGTGLTNLQRLELNDNQLTSFNGTGLTNLQRLSVTTNLLTSFDGTGLSNLQDLMLDSNQLTSFSSAGLTNLTGVSLSDNQLTSFNGTGLSNLSVLYLDTNQLTSFNGTGLTNLTELYLNNNQLTSFNGTNLVGLTTLTLSENQLTSFDATGLMDLGLLTLDGNYIRTFKGYNDLSQLFFITMGNNCLVSQYLPNDTVTWLNNTVTHDSWSSQNASCPVVTFCDYVTDVPVAECQALLNVYNTTGGASWSNKTNWGTSVVVDDWHGVTVAGGHVTELRMRTNNMQGAFHITQGNLNSLNVLEIGYNHLTSFNSAGLSSLNYLDLYDNDLTSFTSTGISSLTYLSLAYNNLTSFSGTGLSNLTYLALNNNALLSFIGTGLSQLTELYLENNQLTSFSGAGLSDVSVLYLNNNNLTSFNGVGLSSIEELNLYSNQLTSFSAAGISSVLWLGLDDNRIASLNANILQTSLPRNNSAVAMSLNCFDMESLPASIVDWLDEASADDWTLRNSGCPPLPSTMWFFGTDGNWNNQSNWYYDASLETGISPKLRPDAADNVVILSSVSSNTGNGAHLATVKTLQAKGDAIVSIPIQNGGGYTYTTSLAGDNNDLTFSAVNPIQDGENIKISYVSGDYSTASVGISSNGSNNKELVVTYSLVGNIVISGAGDTFLNGVYEYDGEVNNHNSYRKGEHLLYHNGVDMWNLDGHYEAYSDNTPSPSGNMVLYPVDGVGNYPAAQLELAPSNASQIKNAIATNPWASTLVSVNFAPGNDGSGGISSDISPTYLTKEIIYATPMSFLDTSVNAANNKLTGDANFACTAQNLGIVTGTVTYTQCDATTAPETSSVSTDTTPTFTGLCAPNTLVTLYNGATALAPSVLCSEGGTYSITPTLSPGTYSITVKQSNRKGPTFGTSNASSPALSHIVGCPEGQAWNGITCASTCTTTEAPSEIKAGVDKPYISCTDSNRGTQFKYRISDPNNPSFTPIVSDTYATGTRVLHDGVFLTTEGDIFDGALDNSFVQTGVGLNNQVLTVAVQPEDGKILVGGRFTTYNGDPAPYLIRLNPDGTRDPSFVQTGTGLNAYVDKIVVLQPSGQILVSGAFSAYDSVAAKRIARLNSNGTLDTSFTQTGTGLSHTVYAMDESGGKILAGGAFSNYNGISVGRIIRLNSDGTRDTDFGQTGTGFNNDPNFIEVQPDGKILVGGFFTQYKGVLAKYLVRLYSDGTRDPYFYPTGAGFNDYVYTGVIQPDGKILIGGKFTSYDGNATPRMLRLNEEDETLDTSFALTGTGFNNSVNTIFLQPDGKILVGGIFTSYNGIAVPPLVRLNSNGTLDTSFALSGSGINASPYVIVPQMDGGILIGGAFTTYNSIPVPYLTRIKTGEIQKGYKIECLYSTDNTTFTADSTCTKTMVVRESTTGNEVQGCARITNSFENFVGYEKWIHTTGFNASISCIARKSDPEVAEGISPFLIQYGSTFTTLGYLSNFFDIGRFTSALDVHTFDGSLSTPTTCAVRVGDGYSTNSLCQNLGCGGSECDAPSQYIIQPSAENLYCTREAMAEYTIGCAPGDSYASCIRNDIVGNLYNGLVYNSGTGKYEKNLNFRFDDLTDQQVILQCPSQTPQTPELQTSTCIVSLPTGKELALLVATEPMDQYQVVYDAVPRDIDAPMASISGSASGVTFDTSNSRVLASTGSEWLNTPVIANIRCINTEPENNDTCTCAWLVKADTTGAKDNTDWGLVSPLKDIVDYQRVIRNESLQNQEFFIFDNVGNMDPDKSKVSITLGVDTIIPSISGTATPGEDNQESVVLQATDNIGGSGLWGYGIRTAVISKTATSDEIKTVFDSSCNVVGNVGNLGITLPSPNLSTIVYAPFPQIGAGFGPVSSDSITYNTTSQKIAYCVQDNAKNKLVGTYPFDPNMLIGCFSDGSQQFVPNLDSANPSGKYYLNNLISRFSGEKYGYELTDSAKSESMLDFRTKLAQNIETLVKQQYCPIMGNFATKSVNLEEKNPEENPLVYAAKAKLTNIACSTNDSENIGPRNTKGYYYFKGDTNNRVLEIAGSPRLTGIKTLIVEGADIYLKGDISYFSRESSLVIIALKDTSGAGGNIYVNPEVTQIDGTLIADGSLMNGVLESGDMIPKVWLTDTAGDLKHPLTINGRLLTYNTRGGSLQNNNDLLQMNQTNPKCVSRTTGISTTCGTDLPFISGTIYTDALVRSGLQDLERFRVVMRVPDELGNRCTLHVTGVPALNRPEILTRSGF